MPRFQVLEIRRVAARVGIRRVACSSPVVLPIRNSGCVRSPKLRFAEIRLPGEGVPLPAFTMAAGPTQILLATFTDLPPGTRVTLALSDPEGPIIVDGRVEEAAACGTRIVFTNVSPTTRLRLETFGRRGLLLDEQVA
jgi:hypothetical protein